MTEGRRFRHVAVLMGGPSAEREVSLRSGAAVAGGLRAAGYTVTAVDVTTHELAIPAGVEAVFIALHGEYGEDGAVQAVLAGMGIPYTGSDPASSHRSFDKAISKRILCEHQIPTPSYEILRPGDSRTLPLPVVVKPLRQGSSIGVCRVRRAEEWADAAAQALQFDGEMLVEQYIPGRELTVGIVAGEVLPAVEIVPPDEWYDYRAKYTQGQSQYRVPAPIDPPLAKQCGELALRTFQALGCRGLGRVDFRVSPEGQPYVLELNSIPGFTETSLLPKAAAAAGISFPELCDRIMRTAEAP